LSLCRHCKDFVIPHGGTGELPLSKRRITQDQGRHIRIRTHTSDVLGKEVQEAMSFTESGFGVRVLPTTVGEKSDIVQGLREQHGVGEMSRQCETFDVERLGTIIRAEKCGQPRGSGERLHARHRFNVPGSLQSLHDHLHGAFQPLDAFTIRASGNPECVERRAQP
jgi:hypothetical protein